MVKFRLDKVLEERQMTVQELAQQIGMKTSTVWEYYHNFNDRIKAVNLAKICEVLECTPADLLEYTKEERPGWLRNRTGFRVYPDEIDDTVYRPKKHKSTDTPNF